MGGIATNYHGEALTKNNGNPDTIIPGADGARRSRLRLRARRQRLGSNSLIDLVVFGRAAAHRCAEILTPAEKQPELPKDCADYALTRLDKFRHASAVRPPRNCG